MELLVDCSDLAGQTFHLMSNASEFPNGVYGATFPGMGAGQQLTGYNPNPMNGADFPLRQLDVDAPLPAAPVFDVPGVLDPSNANPFAFADAAVQRNLTMSPVSMGMGALNGDFVFDGAPFDMNVINHTIEVWSIANNSPLGHPFHIHDVQFYQLERNGVEPPVEERGRRDVVFIPAMQSVKFITQFTKFADDEIPYMYHCHMLVHEDGGMMGQFKVVDGGSEVDEVGLLAASVCPNPATDLLTIPNTESGDTVEIWNAAGQRMGLVAVRDGKTALDVEAFAPGVYLSVARGRTGHIQGRYRWVRMD